MVRLGLSPSTSPARRVRSQELVFNVDYLGGQIGTFAINFSRPAGQVIAQYYEFLRLGREGYTKVQNASYQVAAYLADEIAKLGPYEFICTGRPDEGIPAVCFKLKDGEDPGYTLYDLSERLRLRGWQVPAFTLGAQELVFNVDYLGGQIGTFAINFSRPAGQVIAQYYEFLRLGREGYTKVQNASYQVAAYLADEIAKLGPYEFICTGRPDEGIPAVCFKLKEGEDPGYTLYDLSERLRLRGWQVPAFTLGGEATDIVVMRIMCRRGFEMDFAELLLEDYKASLKYLSDHPKLQGIAQQNSFKHT
ncbi:pyridoxal-dependent decarboxylase [Escherichia coli]|uniref:pyridoxal-dependent decarboxylase n=1 Tax=Escherichia coli TaxID=562 RepID=UPI00386009D3